MKKNIVLIGMPGSGKSTVGVILAKVLGYEFVDSDLVIQKAEGKRLSEIMELVGTDGFLEIEDRINAGLQVEKSVIATGGSAVYCENAMKHLQSIGTIVYLKLSYRKLKKRLGDLRCRGVVLKEGQTLKDLYNERIPLYERYADVTICETGNGVESTLAAIVRALNN